MKVFSSIFHSSGHCSLISLALNFFKIYNNCDYYSTLLLFVLSINTSRSGGQILCKNRILRSRNIGNCLMIIYLFLFLFVYKKDLILTSKPSLNNLIAFSIHTIGYLLLRHWFKTLFSKFSDP